MQNKNVCFYENNQDEEEGRSSILKLQNCEIHHMSEIVEAHWIIRNKKLLDKNKQLEKKCAINHVSVTNSKK